MMEDLMLPDRVPQGQTMREKETLAAIFGALPESAMMKALASVGVQVTDPQSHLAPDDESNAVPSWNERRVTINGNDARPPVWDKNRVIEIPTPIVRGREPAYLSTDYDKQSLIPEMAIAQNAQGGF